MITILSLNTAVDRIMLVPGFTAEEVTRATEVRVYPGGKGLNVARAVRRLGEPVRVIGFLGGTPARFIRERLGALDVEQRWVDIAGETRTCIIVVDPDRAGQTVINEDGPRVSEDDVAALQAEVSRLGAGDLLCISGSAPPGTPAGLYPSIIRAVQARGGRVLADVSGAALAAVTAARPWAMKPNREEFGGAFGPAPSSEQAALTLARSAEHALLTLGAEGVLCAHGGRLWRIQSPPIATRNAVGSGDAFAAGFLVGCARGLEALDAARLGTACGASNASRLEPEIGPPEEIEALLLTTGAVRLQ